MKSLIDQIPFSIITSTNTILLISFEDAKIFQELSSFFSVDKIDVITKQDLVGKSLKSILKITYHKRYDLVVISNRFSLLNRTDNSLKLLALLSLSSYKLILFDEVRAEFYSKLNLSLNLIPKLFFSSLLSLYILIKGEVFFWIVDKVWKKNSAKKTLYSKSIAYLRTDLSGKTAAGGSIAHIKGFIHGAEELGFHVHYFADSKFPSDFETIVIEPNPLLDLFDEIQLIDYHFRFYRKAKRLFKKLKPNLIYHRHSVFNASGVWLSKYFDIPLILEVNHSEVWVKKNWSRLVFEKLAQKIERIAFENADIIGVVSEVTRDQIIPLGAREDRIVVNPNGADINAFSPNIDGSSVLTEFDLKNKIVIGFIGTFTRWHGVEVLFEAALQIVSAKPNIVFLLIGDGNLKANLENKTCELNLANKIIFTGIIPHEEAPKYLSACDILVSPHLGFETGQKFFGSPTKLFEYMAMGKPIIASDLEQIGKIIQHKVNGIKVKPGNATELASAILDLIEDKQLRLIIGTNARHDAEKNFTWKMNAERILCKVKGL